MMIVNELDGTSDFRVSGGHPCRHEMIANEVAKRLQKRSVNRSTGATQLRHNRSLTFRWDYEHGVKLRPPSVARNITFVVPDSSTGGRMSLLTVNLLPAKFCNTERPLCGRSLSNFEKRMTRGCRQIRRIGFAGAS